MRFLTLALVLAAALLLPWSAREAPASAHALWVEAAPGDSAVYVARWAPPVLESAHRPLAGYHVEWWVGTRAWAVDTVQGPTHTLALPRPAAGDSLGPLTIRVRSVDIDGRASEWLVSPPWWLVSEAEDPPAPTDLQVDSAGVRIAAVHTLPEVVTMTEGASYQLCSLIIYEDGTLATQPGEDGRPIPECARRIEAWMSAEMA